MNDIAEIFEPATDAFIVRPDDIDDVIGNAMSRSGRLLLIEQHLSPAFLDLRTRLAGELLQKCVNYRIRTAIVMPDTSMHGTRWEELAREHRQHPLIRIVVSREEALHWLQLTG